MACQFMGYIVRAVVKPVITESDCQFCLTSRKISIGIDCRDDDISHLLKESFFHNIRELRNLNS
jgi:hypothetical protein